jgi:hypothetical protein
MGSPAVSKVQQSPFSLNIDTGVNFLLTQAHALTTIYDYMGEAGQSPEILAHGRKKGMVKLWLKRNKITHQN